MASLNSLRCFTPCHCFFSNLSLNNCIVGDPSTSAMDGATEEEQF